MADGVLTVTYDSTGRVKLSGIVVTNVIRRILCQLGITVRDDDMQGLFNDRRWFDSAKNRTHVITRFNAYFDQDPNPYHATDNLTLAITAA